MINPLKKAPLIAALVATGFMATAPMACANTANDEERLIPFDDDAGVAADAGDDSGLSPDHDADHGDADVDHGDTHDATLSDADTTDTTDTTSDDTDNNSDSPICQPAGDQIMRRDRYPLVLNQGVPFQFSFDVPVDTAGTDQDGDRTWDLSAPTDGDLTAEMTLEDPQDHWFGDSFPEATYAARLSGDPDVEGFGLFELTDQGLYLLGVASPDAGYYRTELTYDPPVTILAFPFEVGDTWETDTTASGSFGGNHFHSHDEAYATTVDAAGQMITPYGTFPVLRVNTLMDRGYWGFFGWTTAEVRTYAFVAECFGTVARIISQEDQAQQHFEDAAEVMRLAQ